MLHSFGDVATPLPETVQLFEEYARNYTQDILDKV